MYVLSSSRTLEVELNGRRSEFADFARLLREGSGEIGLDVISDPHPYERSWKRIVVKMTDRPLVSVRAMNHFGVLEFVGGPKGLDLLGDNFESFAIDSPGPGDHFHLEYYEDHFYLAADSVPLVVAMVAE